VSLTQYSNINEIVIIIIIVLVNFMTLLSVLCKMFLFSFSVSQYFIFSILYNVPCTYLSLHAYCLL